MVYFGFGVWTRPTSRTVLVMVGGVVSIVTQSSSSCIMATNHAMSVFTNSCRSTPRNPKTRLPSDLLDRPMDFTSTEPPNVKTGTSITTEPLSPDVAQSLSTPTTTSPSCPSKVKPVHRWSNERKVAKSVKRPQTAPERSYGSRGEAPLVQNDHDLDYSALFTTLLESNALLHEEIQDLQEEHRRTMSTMERLYESPQRLSVSMGGIRAGNGGSIAQGYDRHPSSRVNVSSGHGDCSQGEQLAQSRPPKLLRDAWVKPQLQPEHQKRHAQIPSCSQASPQGSPYSSTESLQSSAIHTHSILSSSDETDLQEKREHTKAFDVEVQSNPSVPDLTADNTLSSDPSISSMKSSDAASNDPFASPGAVAIERMWDDFSVEEYGPYEQDKEELNKSIKWSPCITIPEPFSMTEREERKLKAKSRSLLSAERERMDREIQEEAELRKKFRSTPMPANTLLPLYELLNARNEQRREDIKRISKQILKATEKPFSFTKREAEKKFLRMQALSQSHERAQVKSKNDKLFKAKPIPKHLFDPQISEQVREQEEYRRIRIKMRAQELLASSKLPGSMQTRGREYTVGSLRKKRLEENQHCAFMTEEHLFQPAINDKLPDYERAYLEFQRQLAQRKRTKQTTTTEPFYLRTQLIPSRKEKVEQEVKQDEQVLPETRWPYVAPRTKVPRRSPRSSHESGSSSSTPYAAQLTETSRLRQSLTHEKLASIAEKEIAEEEHRREKKECGKALQRNISQKSLSHDPSAWLEEKKKQKLHQFR